MSASDRFKRTNNTQACERCRAQKLRCNWPSSSSSTDSSCERCSRKGVQCKKNLNRKVGRPARARPARSGSASLHPMPDAMSCLPSTLWQDSCGRQALWEQSHSGPTAVDPLITNSGLESPPLSGDLSHESDGELMSFFASDLSTEWMAWSSDDPTSFNSSSDSSSSTDSLESASETSPSSRKGHQKPVEVSQEETSLPESFSSESLTSDVASLTACLFELVPTRPARHKNACPTPNASDQPRPTAILRSILQHTQTLSNLARKSGGQAHTTASDRVEPEMCPLAVDGPTKLLLLSCYTKIFQAYRQMFAEVYSGLRSGANMTDLLYDLRVEDIVLDGDDELKILVLMQVVIHKLNTLGVHLGVPERHYVGVGSGTPLGTRRTQSRGLQSSSEETEPTLDAILSGNESDRCVFWGEFKEQNRCMESAAAAFREELGLLRAQLGHWSRCRTVPLGESHGF